MTAQEAWAERHRMRASAWAERLAKEQVEIQAKLQRKRDWDTQLAAFWVARRVRDVDEYADAELRAAFAETWLLLIPNDRDEIRARSGETVTAMDPNTRQQRTALAACARVARGVYPRHRRWRAFARRPDAGRSRACSAAT